MTDPGLLKAAKLSFHAAGIINVGDRRAYCSSIRSLKEQQMLCGAVFQHPSAYGIEPRPKKRDICLAYPLDEDRPVGAFICMAPADKVVIVNQPSMVHQLNFLLQYRQLSGVPDLVLLIILGHGPRGPWPSLSVVFCPVVAEESS